MPVNNYSEYIISFTPYIKIFHSHFIRVTVLLPLDITVTERIKV